MNDKIEILNNSLIQHGQDSNRVYLMKLDKKDVSSITQDLDSLAADKGYTKIFAKIPADCLKNFLDKGYKQEAKIPKFFNGVEDCIFCAKYMSADRAEQKDEKKIKENLDIALEKAKDNNPLYYGYSVLKAGPKDVEQMSQVYRAVFKTYPFPIHDPEYLRETMNSHIDYYIACHKGNIIAVSSAEIDSKSQSAEMTDFATLAPYRGRSLALVLLKKMEADMIIKGIKTVYTIARAMSAGMNITFARNGYKFSGTLINNTNISGNIESMNVWYKRI